jgi:hypothetical protein
MENDANSLQGEGNIHGSNRTCDFVLHPSRIDAPVNSFAVLRCTTGIEDQFHGYSGTVTQPKEHPSWEGATVSSVVPVITFLRMGSKGILSSMRLVIIGAVQA